MGFYSNLFIVPKPNGDVRPILDLKALNQFLDIRSFRMESIHSAVASLYRHQGHVPTCANLQIPSKVSAIRSRQPTFSVCGAAHSG